MVRRPNVSGPDTRRRQLGTHAYQRDTLPLCIDSRHRGGAGSAGGTVIAHQVHHTDQSHHGGEHDAHTQTRALGLVASRLLGDLLEAELTVGLLTFTLDGSHENGRLVVTSPSHRAVSQRILRIRARSVQETQQIGRCNCVALQTKGGAGCRHVQ